ncbi:MAG TPA: PIN domain-containing protein [Candidatus Saccharimonadales bacterium]|nr:PIN domain-containing protein [Candidatus Saccharimonadales bacterium]
MAHKLVFVDTNVLMELLFERSNHDLAKDAVLALSTDDIACTSILSVSTLLYFVELERCDKDTAHNFMSGFKILDMSQEDYTWAAANDQGDFEDALQTACARRHTCSPLITFDKKFDSMYGKFLAIHTIR